MPDDPFYRREPRVAADWPVDMRLGNEKICHLHALNLGPRGICLQGEFPKDSEGKNDTELKLSMCLYPSKGGLSHEIEAELVWQTCQEDPVVSGWRFTSFGPKTRKLLQETIRPSLSLSETGVNGSDMSWPVEDEIELLDYLNVLIKRRWLIIFATCLAALAALFFSITKPKLYTATAKILPIAQSGIPGLKQDFPSLPYIPVLNSIPLNKRMLQRQYTLASEETLVTQSLLVHMGLGEGKMQQGVAGLLGMADFKQVRDGTIEINITATDQGLVAQLANAYIEELAAYELEKANESTQRNLTIIEKRMLELEQELKISEKQLNDFQRTNRDLLSESTGTASYAILTTEIARVEREVTLKQSLFLTVANQYEILRLQRKKETPNFDVISYAEPPLTDRASLFKPAVIGTMVGAMMAVFLAFLLEYLEKKGEAGELAPLMAAWREDRERLRAFFRI